MLFIEAHLVEAVLKVSPVRAVWLLTTETSIISLPLLGSLGVVGMFWLVSSKTWLAPISAPVVIIVIRVRRYSDVMRVVRFSWPIPSASSSTWVPTSATPSSSSWWWFPSSSLRPSTTTLVHRL